MITEENTPKHVQELSEMVAVQVKRLLLKEDAVEWEGHITTADGHTKTFCL